MAQSVFYRTVKVDGLSIFYREAGAEDAPTILLLHGLPSSSRMFEPLFARLSDRYHLVAPDYPGFGHSDWPDPKEFAYTFDRYSEIMNRFTEELGLSRYTLYMHSTSRSRKPTAGMYRALKFTFLTPVTSHWTRRLMRSPHWSETLSVVHIEAS